MMTVRRVLQVALVLVCWGLAGHYGYTADRLVADYGGHAGFQSAVWVAKDLKIFEKYGLDVEVIMITGSARSVAARNSPQARPPVRFLTRLNYAITY